MQSSGVPAKFAIPFAKNAGPSYIRQVPQASQIGVHDGWASLNDGFVPLNFQPVGSGGIPPDGRDVNGIFNQITQWSQWQAAGGPVAWDSAFSTAIGGYPKGAVVASAVAFGICFLSLVDNNTTNPDTGGAGWKAFSPFGGAADYYVDSGAANALVITPQPPVTAYGDGLTFNIDPAHANTGATTLAVSGLAAKPVVHADGSALQSGEVQAGQVMRVVYQSGVFQWQNAPYAVTKGPNDNSTSPASTAYADRAASTAAAALDTFGGYIFGLQLAPSIANPTTAITVSVGAGRDSTNSKTIKLTAPMTKSLTAAWAAGDGSGGRLEATAPAAGQTWFVHVLENSTTGQVDWGYSQSPHNPPLPTGYDVFRRLGAVVLDAAAATIRPFIQTGDYFEYTPRSADYANTSQSNTAPVYRPVSVPYGIRVLADFYFQSVGSTDTVYLSGVYDPAAGTPSFGAPTQFAQARRTGFQTASGYVSYITTMVRQWTDTTAHVYTATTDTSELMALGVMGWFDFRDRLYP